MAKREKLTDRERAKATAWDYNREHHDSKPWAELTDWEQRVLRHALSRDAEMIYVGMKMGCALATKGGKSGKGRKGKKGATR